MNNKPDFNQQGDILLAFLREIALQKGLTHQEIADRTGWTATNVSRILSAKYAPSLPNFLKLAHAIEINFFFESKDSNTELNVAFEKAMGYIGRRKPKNFN